MTNHEESILPTEPLILSRLVLSRTFEESMNPTNLPMLGYGVAVQQAKFRNTLFLQVFQLCVNRNKTEQISDKNRKYYRDRIVVLILLS